MISISGALELDEDVEDGVDKFEAIGDGVIGFRACDDSTQQS